MEKKLRGYITPDGYLGEVVRNVWRMFATEEEWKEYVQEHKVDIEIRKVEE